MRFRVTINQKKCDDFGVSVPQAALMELFSELPSWADPVTVDGETYYHISRGKVITELPKFFNKPDTVWRHFKILMALSLIDYLKDGRRDLVRLTAKGKGWNKLGNKSELYQNSEMNPSKLGNKSELGILRLYPENINSRFTNSEMNPTDKVYKDTIHTNAWDFLEKHCSIWLESFLMKNKKQLGDIDFFKIQFNSKVDTEALEYSPKILKARLEGYAGVWVFNHKNKTENQTLASSQGYKRVQL